MQWANDLPKKTRFLAWESLIASKISYGLVCLTRYSSSLKDRLHQFFYRSLKGLLGIRSNPSQNLLQNIILGPASDSFLKDLQNLTQAQISQSQDLELVKAKV